MRFLHARISSRTLFAFGRVLLSRSGQVTEHTTRRWSSSFQGISCHGNLPPPPFTKDQLPLKAFSSLTPKKGEVVVSVKVAAVNFPDVLIAQGKYQMKPEKEFSPGFEFSGTVKALGEGVKHLQAGDRVIGFVPWGAFAEEVAVSRHNLIKMPEKMDFKDGASLLMAYGTSFYALHHHGAIKEKDTVLILGASGGVGLAALELAKAHGARVVATASEDSKLELCKSRGADVVINYKKDDLKKALKEVRGARLARWLSGHFLYDVLPDGADIVYDPVGGDLTETALRNVKWNGRYLVIGFASGDIPKIPLNLPLLKGCSIHGVFWGSFAMREPERLQQQIKSIMELYLCVICHSQFVEVLTCIYSTGKIKPHVSAEYGLEDTYLALNSLAGRKATGKVLLKMQRPPDVCVCISSRVNTDGLKQHCCLAYEHVRADVSVASQLSQLKAQPRPLSDRRAPRASLSGKGLKLEKFRSCGLLKWLRESGTRRRGEEGREGHRVFHGERSSERYTWVIESSQHSLPLRFGHTDCLSPTAEHSPK
eukprot:763817-Hanusia_phi.AAC.3